MNLVIIFGPLAVGKMTVGQELEKITALKSLPTAQRPPTAAWINPPVDKTTSADEASALVAH